MNKPDKAQFKRGNAYYTIVNNALKVYIDHKWIDSSFSLKEFKAFDDIQTLNKSVSVFWNDNVKELLKRISMGLLVCASVIFATWVMR